MIGIPKTAFAPWTGADCVAIARFEEWNLAYTADGEIAQTRSSRRPRARSSRPPSRAGFLVDAVRFAPLDPDDGHAGGLPERRDAHDGALHGRSADARASGPATHPLPTPRVSPDVLGGREPFVNATAARRDALARLGRARVERLDRRAPRAPRPGHADARQRSAPVAQRAVGLLDGADRRARSVGRRGHERRPRTSRGRRSRASRGSSSGSTRTSPGARRRPTTT